MKSSPVVCRVQKHFTTPPSVFSAHKQNTASVVCGRHVTRTQQPPWGPLLPVRMLSLAPVHLPLNAATGIRRCHRLESCNLAMKKLKTNNLNSLDNREI
ncbi:hypothetical protein J6590_006099 [Homalodisca vitripennis]|nr:hypothetical protein J6590_006099 [Homalodisca vitripennis]